MPRGIDRDPKVYPIVRLVCDFPGCGSEFVGPERGKGSATFKLGSHKYRTHGPGAKGASRTKGARGRERPTEDEFVANPVVATLRDVQAEIATGTGPPKEQELTRALGRGLGLVSVAVASYAVETEPTLSNAERDAIADELSLPPNAAADVVRPIAHWVAPTKLNERFGRQVVENVDVVASFAELGKLALAWRRYFRDRAERQARYRPSAPVAAASYPAPPAEGGVPPPFGPGPDGAPVEYMAPPEGYATVSPAPQEGVVVDAVMVQTMRRGNNGAG